MADLGMTVGKPGPSLSKAIALCAIVPLLLLVRSAPASGLAAADAAPPRSRIAVLGATGRLGARTVRELLERDVPVRCLVRPSSLEKLPDDLARSPLVEVVAGDLLSEGSRRTSDGAYDDDLVAPSNELVKCLGGCAGVVACHGATRTTKFADLFRSPEDVDPNHAKQINYRSMIALVVACKAVNRKAGDRGGIGHVVRVTGKGEDPTSIFTVLLNGLGSFAKAWNYQGEAFLRTALADDDAIGYTIVRPGIMKEGDVAFANDDLVLADDGGNDLRVTPVAYSQVANLLAELVLSAGDGRIGAKRHNDKVTLASMNPSDDGGGGGDGGTGGKSLAEKIAALRNDRREFPKSLVAEHKAAVKSFFTKLALVLSGLGIGLATLLSKVFF